MKGAEKRANPEALGHHYGRTLIRHYLLQLLLAMAKV